MHRSGAELRKIVSALDLDSTLANLTHAAMQQGAACCIIYQSDGDGGARRISLHATDPAHDTLLQRLRDQPLGAGSARRLASIVTGGVPQLLPTCDPKTVDSENSVSWDVPLFRGLPVRSALIVPLAVAPPAMAMALYAASPERQYGADDQSAVAELAEWAAVAIANARALSASQEVARRRDHLVSVLTHDLGNPITALRLIVSLLGGARGDKARTEELLDYLTRIGTTVSEIEQMVEEIRDLRRIDAGTLNLLHENNAPAMIVGDIIERATPLAEGRGVRIATRIVTNTPAVLADRWRAVQALSLVLNHAVQRTKLGGEVGISVSPSENVVEFAVRDDPLPGHKMDTDRLFERFWDRAFGKAHQEANLHMAIVSGIARAHGGRAWANSEESGALTIGLSLPRADSAV